MSEPEAHAVPAQAAVESAPSAAPSAAPIPDGPLEAHDRGGPPRHEANGEVRIPVMDAGPGGPRITCTSAQLRRFIKSRPWVPLHELRRRFGISGDDDDVSPIRVGHQLLFIGLPPAEARMVGELLSGGDVGYELSLDPTAPIVVGVYPMRPVPRGRFRPRHRCVLAPMCRATDLDTVIGDNDTFTVNRVIGGLALSYRSVSRVMRRVRRAVWGRSAVVMRCGGRRC